jgi:hypothetical protein
MDLDVKYLGVSFDLPLWGLLILSARAPEVVDGLHNDEATQAAMNADANWGMILKIGFSLRIFTLKPTRFMTNLFMKYPTLEFAKELMIRGYLNLI